MQVRSEQLPELPQGARLSLIGLVREVSPQLGDCELTHLARSAIDTELARRQHEHYVTALRELGIVVQSVAALPHAPDGAFVEDTAVVLPEVAVITRPGAASRQIEVASVARELERLRPLVVMSAPACLDGGDVMRIGKVLFAGTSTRSNPSGIAELRRAAEPFGYVVRPLDLSGCLHLKSACSFVPPHSLVVNPAWIDADAFSDWTLIPVDPDEPFAANTLTLGNTCLVSASYPRTMRRLQVAGIHTRAVDIAEFHKAEAGLTCLSIIV